MRTSSSRCQRHHAKPLCKCVQRAAVPLTFQKTLHISDDGTWSWPAADPTSGSQSSASSLQPCKGIEEFLGQAGQWHHQTSHKTWFTCTKLWTWQREEQQAPAEVNGVIPGNSFPWTQEGPQASILKKSRVFISGWSFPRFGRDSRAPGRQTKYRIIWTN